MGLGISYSTPSYRPFPGYPLPYPSQFLRKIPPLFTLIPVFLFFIPRVFYR